MAMKNQHTVTITGGPLLKANIINALKYLGNKKLDEMKKKTAM
ncbi:hypothetical protein [Paenibacillus sp. sgz500992]